MQVSLDRPEAYGAIPDKASLPCLELDGTTVPTTSKYSPPSPLPAVLPLDFIGPSHRIDRLRLQYEPQARVSRSSHLHALANSLTTVPVITTLRPT